MEHMVSTALLLSRQTSLSLLLLVLLTSCSAQSTYYVTPTPNTPCPGEPCHTLSEYVDDQLYFTNNTVMEFIPGNHTLAQTISVTNLMWLTLRGDSSSLPDITSRILCTSSSAGFVFADITGLYITALAFISCAHNDSGPVSIISVQQSDISNCTFQNSINSGTGQGGGLYVENSNLILTGSTFQNNSAEDRGGGLYVVHSNLTLTGNTFQNNSAEFVGGGLYAVYSNLTLTGSIFQNNSALVWGGGLCVGYNSTLTLTGNIFQNNSAEYGGGGGLYVSNSNLTLTGNTFQNNSAPFGGTLYIIGGNMTFTDDYFTDSYGQLGGAILAITISNLRMYSIKIENCRAEYGGGIAALGSKLELLETTIIDNNTAIFGGGVYAYSTQLNISAIITSNSVNDGGGGIYAARSSLSFTETTEIINNSATVGGGLLLSGDSQILLHPHMTLHLTSNHARKNGGAIKVEESNPLTYCIPTVSDNIVYVSSSDCFYQSQIDLRQYHVDNILSTEFLDDLDIKDTIFFVNNSAVEGGNDLYGGSVDSCTFTSIDSKIFYSGLSDSGYVFDHITSSSDENKPGISSNPLHICTCQDNLTDCTGSYNAGPVYPGGTLEVPVIAHGQRNGTTAAIIRVIHTPNKIIDSHENLQNISNICTTLKYTISSRAVGTTQEMTLYAEGPCSPTQTNTLTVTVNIQHCPHGFQLAVNEPICICAERIQQFTNTCLVDSTTVLRQLNDEFWVGYSNDNDSESRGLIIHAHCPFDFCTTKETYFAVDDSDKQCNYNRSGFLCGRCGENLSLALGSSRCLQCSNTYLTLLAVFAFAGIALVLLLLVLRLTVAVGTMNGLIFYANIIAVNSKVFLQPQATNVLTVFIAWLNLDLGIETCFYDGMDAYVKTWLQFVFPLYVWALIGMIVLGSYYSGRVAKIFGRNPIAVLATLFLLSYAKLLRTVIAALSFTSLEYPNNSRIAVWLYDGNVRYLSAKHIPLFTASMVCLIFLFLPYTILLIFGQWLQARSQLKIFSCINNR